MDLLERSAGCSDRHPWELARGDFVLELARRVTEANRPTRWLDVGSGDGWLATLVAGQLPEGSEVRCWDTNYTAADLDELRGAAPASLTFSAEPPDGTFDVISMLDVIEHVEDDERFVRGVLDGHARVGTSVIVTVPAHQRLFSEHDVALRHFRRYSPRGARDLLERCDLEVLTEGGLFAALLPLRALQVALERVRGGRSEGEPASDLGEWRGGAALTGAVRRILAFDSRAGMALARHGVRWPGLSYWAVSRRTSR